jgi:DNA repair exonuclease SbcCD ATPase subunit/DNA repair exonuclease SbcCD nuclease subunit
VPKISGTRNIMSYKIAHISDTHIRNLKYHKEYREVFQKIFDKLKEEKPDYIVHCGDIAHTKTQISPEFVEMCAWFLDSLAKIAPTYVILGNHDGNLKNSSRQDALTPIVEALGNPNLHLLKSSGERVLESDLALNVLSIFDEDNWVPPSNDERINIALYHGSISGVQTDTGYVLENGEHDIDIFKDFDYALLGDIHKTDQVVDTEGRVRYPGSTIQQNHGETNDKGFLLWDIRSKDDFDVKHIAVENPRPFVTIELTPKGKIPKNTVINEGARIRLATNSNLSLHQLRRAADVAKKRFKPESITTLHRGTASRSSLGEVTDGLEYEDLRDPSVQEELIREFLTDYEVDDDVLERIIELNKKYNSQAEDSEDTLRNVKWSLKKLEWDNLFNYGKDNKIDFDALNGVVGIFGKNFSGKSSIVDSFLWTLQNSTSKNVRKNLNIINQNKNSGGGRIEMAVGNDMYIIERSADKYIKKLKGEETQEAKTNLDFTKYDMVQFDECPEHVKGNENGIDRRETDKNIRKVFGTLEDFLFTSMTSQVGSLAFINEGSTKRKEILGKFLDLDIFAKKFRFANEDAAEIKGALKRLEGRDFDAEIFAATQEVEENETATRRQKSRCDVLKSQVQQMEKEISELDKQIAASPDLKVWDINAAQANLKDLKEKEGKYQVQNKEVFALLAEKRSLLQKTSGVLEGLDVEDAERKKKLVFEKEKELNRVLSEINASEQKKRRQENKVSLLKEVPCGDKFPTCKFLVDAHAAKKNKIETEELVQLLNKKRSEISSSIDELHPTELDKILDKYNALVRKKRDIEMEISQKQIEVEKNNTRLVSTRNEIVDLEKQIEEYNKNKSAAALLKILHETRGRFVTELSGLNEELEECETEMLDLYKSHGSLEQKLQSLEELKGELSDLRIQYAAYDLYERCMHSNGISYDIIKKRLPIINEEIAKVLANVVNFEVFFEDDGKKLDILIKHPKYDPRPLELGSGAEKMLSAMAIRLALIKISSLPQGDLFILDEPATALDEENMEGFIRIIDMLKSQFKTIIIISHLDALKDIVDKQIVIDKSSGFARVEV